RRRRLSPEVDAASGLLDFEPPGGRTIPPGAVPCRDAFDRSPSGCLFLLIAGASRGDFRQSHRVAEPGDLRRTAHDDQTIPGLEIRRGVGDDAALLAARHAALQLDDV